MSTAPEPADFPEAQLKKRRWAFPIIWVVPLVAALVAAYMVYERIGEYGPAITIKFKDVSGVKPGQTQIKYRGVPIGEVTAVELSDDHRHALVRARLQRSAASIARAQSVFWIVRPEVGISNITGLGTVISGPEIGVAPGDGAARTEFVGRDGAPITPEYTGLEIVLKAPRLSSLRAKSPVYYRGVEVGLIQDIRLGRKATTVDLHVVIRKPYAALVREGTRFWNVSGIEANFGLFHGLEINVESLRSLVAGGIAFATPGDARPARDGAVYTLYDKPEPEWLEWAPEIAIAAQK